MTRNSGVCEPGHTCWVWLVEEINLESESRSWDLGRPCLALGENQPQTPAGKLLQDPGQKVFRQCLSLTLGVLPAGRRRKPLLK